jgi:hypothetical protein
MLGKIRFAIRLFLERKLLTHRRLAWFRSTARGARSRSRGLRTCSLRPSSSLRMLARMVRYDSTIRLLNLGVSLRFCPATMRGGVQNGLLQKDKINIFQKFKTAIFLTVEYDSIFITILQYFIEKYFFTSFLKTKHIPT